MGTVPGVRPSSRRLSRARRAAPLAVAAAALLLTAACGGSSSGGSSTTSSTGAAGSGGAVVKVAKTSLGSVLETSNGRVIYLLTADKSAASSCTGGCLQLWPPVTAVSTAPSAPGVSAKLAVLERPDGTRQLTVAGHPAYTYAADTAAGQTSGQGITSYGGTWWALSPAGAAVKSASGGTRGGGGYGY
jgi:predicted lipoprotein with Yx(FWY)xxD motif